MNSQIHVNPLVSRIDESVHINIKNIPPNTHVTVRATTDNILGLTCAAESWATFLSGSNGAIDMDTERPVGGTYHNGLQAHDVTPGGHRRYDLVKLRPELFRKEKVIAKQLHMLAKDVLEIITVFSARLYGAHSRKNQKLIHDMKRVIEDATEPQNHPATES